MPGSGLIVATAQSISNLSNKMSIATKRQMASMRGGTGTVSDNLILFNKQCPGDVIAITAAIYSLHRHNPGKYKTRVEGVYADEIYANNPNISPIKEGRRLEMHCPNIQLSHLPNCHFISTWCDYLGGILGVNCSLATSIPMLYLSDEEKALPKLKNHIIVNAGYKSDCEAKYWGYNNFQTVVNMMPDKTFVQIGESWHNHAPLIGKNVINIVGRQNAKCRPFIQLVSQCEMGLGGVTFLGHICAALHKPYICLNFREPTHFIQYPLQRTLSVNGCLKCNKQACWKSGLKPDTHNRCALPMLINNEWVSKCSTMISPEEVVKAIRDFGG